MTTSRRKDLRRAGTRVRAPLARALRDLPLESPPRRLTLEALHARALDPRTPLRDLFHFATRVPELVAHNPSFLAQLEHTLDARAIPAPTLLGLLRIDALPPLLLVRALFHPSHRVRHTALLRQAREGTLPPVAPRRPAIAPSPARRTALERLVHHFSVTRTRARSIEPAAPHPYRASTSFRQLKRFIES